MERNHDDAKDSLLEIACRSGKPILSLMLDIEGSTLAHGKILNFIKNLECLRPEKNDAQVLSRRWINAFENRDFVALSYTWEHSEHEDPSCGRYVVQTRDGSEAYESPVRDCVFDRVLNYMRQSQSDLLWIDRHCIKQRTCGQVACSHRGCSQKRDGLEAMDLVYRLSRYPVTLLGRPIESRHDLRLLAKILEGELVSRNWPTEGFRLSGETTRSEAMKALALLSRITSDLWWKRAWTFQESYRAGSTMRLLIPHPSFLENQKRSYDFKTFGGINKELCINSVHFSYEATRLCLAFQLIGSQTQEESQTIHRILATAGRYTILLENHESMSPTIIADIENRDVKQRWDRLAIAANCCQYPMRLDVQELQRKNHSISLSMLTMCLLNGEILDNGEEHGPPSGMTVSTYLKEQSFKGFYAPLDERCLSFNKGCRFIDARLTTDGIFTQGHLWKLGEVIYSRELDSQQSWVRNPVGRLGLHGRKRFTQLANKLKSLGHFLLADQLQGYLHRDTLSFNNQSPSVTFAESYMGMMASELVDAIDRRMTLRLASLWDAGKTSAYRAIFIIENSDDFNQAQGNTPAFVFTASRPEIPSSDELDTNDVDRHVSLEVRCTESAVPRLYIKRWLLGLCFFKGFTRRDVLFPWPPGLKSVVPQD